MRSRCTTSLLGMPRAPQPSYGRPKSRPSCRSPPRPSAAGPSKACSPASAPSAGIAATPSPPSASWPPPWSRRCAPDDRPPPLPPLPHPHSGWVGVGRRPPHPDPAARGRSAAGHLPLAGLQAGPFRPVAEHPPGCPRPARAGGGAAPHRTRRPPPGARGECGRVSRPDPLAAHIRRLGNHDLNELLVQLAKPTFAALVEVALARPVLPAGLLLRYEPAPGVDGWMVVACAPRRRLGTLTRDRAPDGQRTWRAWSRVGDPVQVAGIGRWRRRGDAAAALAWVSPASGARFMALAAHVRSLPDPELHALLRGLPCDLFDR